MKRFALTALAILWCAAISAAEMPENAKIDGDIRMALNQIQILRFKSAFQTVNVVTDGVVKASARTDHDLALSAVAEGQTILFVYAPDGAQLYSASVTVSQEPGHVVRMYGRSKDYIGFYCTETACGRADKELNGARDVSSVTTVSPGGTAITRTFGGAR